MVVTGRPVIAGSASGRVLRLDHPLSFWGGVDPATGRITDPRSPQCGIAIGGRVLMLPETRGSSSSSAVMLELLARGLAPAAIAIGRVDAILGLGIIVGREMGHGSLPLIELPASLQAAFADGTPVAIGADGTIADAEPGPPAST